MDPAKTFGSASEGSCVFSATSTQAAAAAAAAPIPPLPPTSSAASLSTASGSCSGGKGRGGAGEGGRTVTRDQAGGRSLPGTALSPGRRRKREAASATAGAPSFSTPFPSLPAAAAASASASAVTVAHAAAEAVSRAPVPGHKIVRLRPRVYEVPTLAYLCVQMLAEYADSIVDLRGVGEDSARQLLREIMSRQKLTYPLARIFMNCGDDELSRALATLNLWDAIPAGRQGRHNRHL